VKASHAWTWQKETIRDGQRAQVYFCALCDVFRISWRVPNDESDVGFQQNRYRFKGEAKDRFSSVCIPDTDPEIETDSVEETPELSLK
jgi:hypothetical protein